MPLDKKLVTGCRKGQSACLEAVYRQHYAFAMSVCLRYAASRDEALELLNDGFMKAFTRIDSYDEKRPFRPWLRRIMVNTCLDRLRADAKRRSLFEPRDSPEAAVEAEFDLNMDAEEILALFNQLSDMGRAIFNLYEVEGYTHEEIAEMLKIAPGTSRSLLSRTKAKLAQLYAKRHQLTRHETL